MNTKAITDKMQGLLDELVRAPAVTNPAKIMAAKADYTERFAAILAEPEPAKANVEKRVADSPRAQVKEAVADTAFAKRKAEMTRRRP
jgi:hypothetical protein